MPRFKQYGLVRVRQVLKTPDSYDGWRLNKRAPAVGDIGTLLDVISAAGLPDRYLVETSGRDGVTIWLADFAEDELEAVSEKDAKADA